MDEMVDKFEKKTTSKHTNENEWNVAVLPFKVHKIRRPEGKSENSAVHMQDCLLPIT